MNVDTHIASWLKAVSAWNGDALVLLHGGVGKRRYYRVPLLNGTAVLMDARKEPATLPQFRDIAIRLHDAGLSVPSILAQRDHFLLLEDFGDHAVLDALSADTVDDIYAAIMRDLKTLQALPVKGLPDFNTSVYEEKIAPLAHTPVFKQLMQEVHEQPFVPCHRDFHALNIMVRGADTSFSKNSDSPLGYLDFQGLSLGPITYDLASLLMDCYIDWPQEQRRAWVARFYQMMKADPVMKGFNQQQFYRWFVVTGLMRHLRCYLLFSGLKTLNATMPYDAYLNRLQRYIDEAVLACPEYTVLGQLDPHFFGKGA